MYFCRDCKYYNEVKGYCNKKKKEQENYIDVTEIPCVDFKINEGNKLYLSCTNSAYIIAELKEKIEKAINDYVNEVRSDKYIKKEVKTDLMYFKKTVLDKVIKKCEEKLDEVQDPIC